jgi:phenylacetate-CoA ligase
VRSILLPAVRWRDGHRDFRRFFHHFARTQYLPPDQLRHLQLGMLQDLLRHAYEHCPYYRRQFEQAGVTPSAVRDLDDLLRLPTLSKHQVRENLDGMLARNYQRHVLRRDQTGGSTGSAMTFYRDERRADARLAVGYRHDQWAGWRIGERTSYIWGALRDLGPLHEFRSRVTTRFVRRSTFLNAARLDRETMARFAADLARWRPALIIAYAGAAYVFARFMLEQGIEVPPPRAVITSAELLQPHQRRVIEQGLRAPVFDRYGARETGVIASECECHQGLHIAADSVLVEVLANGRSAPPGETGEVVVTDLLNYGMPMIRYRIGDMAAFSERRCNCGRGLPLLEMRGGRTSDFLVTPSGRMVSAAYLTCVIAQRPGLEHVQFIQDRRDHVEVRVMPGREFVSADLDYLNQKMGETLGSGVTVSVQLVREIHRAETGKYRFCFCRVPTPATADAAATER